MSQPDCQCSRTSIPAACGQPMAAHLPTLCCMTAGSSDRATDDDGTWTSETLPMSLRRELLERELAKLGFRKAGQGGAMQQQQQPQAASGRPRAGSPEDDPSDQHAD